MTFAMLLIALNFKKNLAGSLVFNLKRVLKKRFVGILIIKSGLIMLLLVNISSTTALCIKVGFRPSSINHAYIIWNSSYKK